MPEVQPNTGAAPDDGVTVLLEALKCCQSALAMVTAPDTIRSTSVTVAWATCIAAEAQARAALAQAGGR
jgi:hypothetical protein